jgi:hypothetical protein
MVHSFFEFYFGDDFGFRAPTILNQNASFVAFCVMMLGGRKRRSGTDKQTVFSKGQKLTHSIQGL